MGRTWFELDVRPALYWRLWSDSIVHAIHERVLRHIKKLAEEDAARVARSVTSPPGAR